MLEKIRSALNYNQDSGVFTWAESRGSQSKGSIAGSVNSDGYIAIQVFGITYLAHRLAWLFVYNEMPPQEIDHINRRKTHNAISNLRLASRSQNTSNSSVRDDSESGVKGIRYRKDIGKYQCRLTIDGKRVCVGSYSTIEEAINARQEAVNQKWQRH
ncbi:TPA: HNH endonuclease [Escherichia coli]|nr:HNH endonuclease [Escherichia coli]HCR3036324.1 HNH endonuclease [Escherichia coli]HCR3053564.1 HNH endonuclease [Escherichia coli]HCR3085011.1 HNH endonuclease [Escherichia coli]HCR3089892.1 HNH endonuclease [Escherichia coli]